ncbi:MAG: NAD(P)H-dependent oxidoreductase subunit E [Oligoflexia bacterium]|nr:NAD(P)H-dependent oxidoreductase subunit E [Oligoflexia bacterium]
MNENENKSKNENKNKYLNMNELHEHLIIPRLRNIQEEHGYVSMKSMRELAESLSLPLMKIREVATFYTFFNTDTNTDTNKKAVGKLHIQMCTNIACWLAGAHQLLHSLENKLSIKSGETTTDNLFTISEVECLAACGTAPAMQVNETYVENLTEEKIMKLIDLWREEMKTNGVATLDGCCISTTTGGTSS